MSERYSRLFTLPENLYAVGSPIVIAAGTLLKDNQTGKIVAQLKLKSISNKTIKAVKVKLDLLDTAGNPLAESVEHDYLDLNVSRDAEFGQKNPVMVPNAKARSYTASVVEVVFADRSIWTADGNAWEPLSKPQILCLDVELLKQYRMRFGQCSTYVPKEEKDLWHCTCGTLNHLGEGCHCGNSLFELQTVDMVELAAEKDARLTQEREAAEAKAAAERAAAEATKKKTAKILKIAIPVVCVVIAIVLFVTKVIIPNGKYNDAVALMEAGQYGEAIVAFEAMDGYKDSAAQIIKCEDAIIAAEQARIEAEMAAKFAQAEELLSIGDYDGAIIIFESLADYEGSAEGIVAAKEGKNQSAYKAAEALEQLGESAYAAIAFGKLGEYRNSKERSFALWNSVAVRETISCGFENILGLCNNGAIVAVGNNKYDQCQLSDWTDIVAVSSGSYYSLGLHSDGTVSAKGKNDIGQCYVSDWTNIVAIDAGVKYAAGIKADGTVVTTGNIYGVDQLTDIISVSAGWYHTVGLKADGTVVAIGENKYGECDVAGWTDIVAISAGLWNTVGLKSDGTVVTTGYLDNIAADLSSWSNIIAISAKGSHVVGLQADGTVLALGDNNTGQCYVSDWTNIVAISASSFFTAGLNADGTAVSVGSGANNLKCDVSDWSSIKVPN